MALRAVPDHPKFARLKAYLGQPKGAVMGWLEAVWHFTGRFTPQGNIGKYTNQTIEAWVEWDGEPGFLIDGLIETGWIDVDTRHRLLIHDWAEHADKATKNALGRAKTPFCTPSVRTPYVERTYEKPESGNTYRLPEPVPEPVPEKEQKPSRRRAASGEVKHSSDPRHIACKEAIFSGYRGKNGTDPEWDGREGKALGMLLRASPNLTAGAVEKLVAHWARSDVNHGDRPSIWIPKLSSFRIPVDRFNKPMEGANGQRTGTSFGKGAGIIEATQRAIADVANSAAGHSGDGTASSGGFGNSEVLRGQLGDVRDAGSVLGDLPALPHKTS